MNKDLLIKLTKLANHNPNDHEANTAARRVCKMLEEANFILDKPQPRTAASKINVTSNPTKQAHEWVRTYYDEPPRDVIWEDILKDLEDKMNRDKTKQRYDPVSEPSFDPFIYNYQRTKPGKDSKYNPGFKQKLNCTKCRQDIETGYVGHPATFVCTPCQWKGNL